MLTIEFPSPWVSVPFALVLETTWLEWVLLFLGLSGGAVLIERLLPKDAGPPPANYVEDLPPRRTTMTCCGTRRA